MNSYIISKEAYNDLDQIWLYTFDEWSKEQADRYYEEIMREIDWISKNPNTGKTINETREGYRFIPVKSHLIFYKETKPDVIEIIRILHKRMKLRKHL
ncbi:MAG: type II toxin-antitoxin system RelE/ParE family toxin [Nonlabens sp.]